MKQDHDFEGVYFTLGKLSIYQFNKFYDVAGINGLRLFQYIRTKQGLIPRGDPGNQKPTSWILVDNHNLEKWFGVHPPQKWVSLVKLEEAKLIEVNRKGTGKCPLVRIICPEKVLH
jgi:hypothetical protein|tara:strand:- start:1139 stop:1486 length:348 start_codon:yes stop_codon:yes gene_type:complete